MAKPAYTFEVATNAPKGVWKVADRTFWDRRLTLGEKQKAWSVAHKPYIAGDDVPVLAGALTVLKVEGEAITEEWVMEHLTDDDVSLTFAFILGGAANVAKLLAADA